MRVGIGYDVHPFVHGRALILGGVLVEHDRGLDGHSDADVLVHAVMDALLGAAALGDIGHHFPPGDPDYRGASSVDLLEKVMGLLDQRSRRCVNVDSVITMESPRIAPHIPEMRANLAKVIRVDVEDIGIKATTSEGLGFVGRAEGASAWAVALVE